METTAQILSANTFIVEIVKSSDNNGVPMWYSDKVGRRFTCKINMCVILEKKLEIHFETVKGGEEVEGFGPQTSNGYAIKVEGAILIDDCKVIAVL